MTQPLLGRVALVTGASRGIGRAVALDLARAGADMVLAARTQTALAAVAGEIAALGRRALAVPVDMADEPGLQALVGRVRATFERLDILVNNAGVTLSAPLAESSTADWDRVHAINARGPFILCRECVGLLERARPGYIVNLASVVGVKGYARQIVYSASKHALRGMTIALAEELRDRDIRVHVICPGGVHTEMVTQVRPDIATEDLMTPEEIGALVRYLVTQRGNAVVDEIRVRRRTSSPWF